MRGGTGRAGVLFGSCVAAVALFPAESHAANIFVESGGVVSAEAEHFSNRDSGAEPRAWRIVPDETPRVGTYTGTMSGGSALQSLADTGGGAPGTVPDTTPLVDFVMRITTTGTYRLYLKGAGVSGTSDSLYAQIVERRDFAAGGLPDYYASAIASNGNLDTWNGSGALENGTASTANAMTWSIPTPGDYTVRITMREDGSLFDKVVLQRDNLAAPTGAGPAESVIVPEPASMGVLGIVALGLLGRRRRHA